MPRQRKPPRLERRKERDGRLVWVIRDGATYRRTGCAVDQAADAEQSLREYLGHKAARPNTDARLASKAGIADVMSLYLDAKESAVARPAELRARAKRIVAFWGDKTVDAIRGPLCRLYVSERGAAIAARRELETLRAAVRFYSKEHGLDVVPLFSFPENGASRTRWLTRPEAARLLLACMGWIYDEDTEAWSRPTQRWHDHLRRFVLIGLYTGTRHQAILSLQWMPNTTGGWIDLERGVVFRRAEAEQETNKRRPPARLPPRLLAHLRRWHEEDGGQGYIVKMNGEGLARIEKGFRGIRKRSGLGSDVTPHVLRHTRATWLMQKGVPLNEAAQSLGMTMKVLEDRYWHHHPDFQRQAAEAY